MKTNLPVKTYGAVPKTLLNACRRNADKISEVGNEGQDGYWVYLRDGWLNTYTQTMAIHEHTVAQCIAQLKYLKPDHRPENMR